MCGGCSCLEDSTPEEILTDVSKMLLPKIKEIKVEQFGVYQIILNFQEVTALQIWLNVNQETKVENNANT
jgi:hypothetical protein